MGLAVIGVKCSLPVVSGFDATTGRYALLTGASMPLPPLRLRKLHGWRVAGRPAIATGNAGTLSVQQTARTGAKGRIGRCGAAAKEAQKKQQKRRS